MKKEQQISRNTLSKKLPQETSTSRLIVALLLTILSPGLGHIYLARKSKGFCIMLLFWLSTVGVFIYFFNLGPFEFQITSKTKIGFRMTPFLFRANLVEMFVVFLYSFVDCIMTIDWDLKTIAKDSEPLYTLLIDIGGKKEQRQISRSKISIGRSPFSDIVLNYPTVSRKHAIIYRHGDDFVLKNANSKNGTKLNGKFVKSCILRKGNVIGIDKVELTFL